MGLNYRHSFHAGNFADVVKHITLIALINALKRKEAPFYYYDTHAGRGYYDFLSEPAQKSKEYTLGIEKIMRQENPPPLVLEYVRIVQEVNNHLSRSKFASLRFYPGSPCIARQLLRSKDHMALSELQPQEYQVLKTIFSRDAQVSIHNIDGYLGLKALLPPKERRGLILIDPPFEDPDEFTRAYNALLVALKRFQNGVFAFWYPIKEPHQVARLHRELKMHVTQPMLLIELCIHPEDITVELNGCGLIIINPPWQFEEEMKAVLPWIWKTLSIHQQGRSTCNLLK